jgi:SAM-dependent methyltransferase
MGPEARVLDAGGGSGNASLSLCRRGFDPLLLDVSPEMVALWERKARAEGFEPRSETATLEAFFASDERVWDLIVFSSVLHHLEDPVSLLESAASRLAPGGTIVTVFDPLELEARGTWLRRFDYLCWVLLETPGRIPGLFAQRLRRPEADGQEDNLGAIAEYHAVTGLRDRDIIAALSRQGLEVVVHDRIYDARFALIRRLARRMRMPTAFSLVLRSPQAPG